MTEEILNINISNNSHKLLAIKYLINLNNKYKYKNPIFNHLEYFYNIIMQEKELVSNFMNLPKLKNLMNNGEFIPSNKIKLKVFTF